MSRAYFYAAACAHAPQTFDNGAKAAASQGGKRKYYDGDNDNAVPDVAANDDTAATDDVTAMDDTAVADDVAVADDIVANDDTVATDGFPADGDTAPTHGAEAMEGVDANSGIDAAPGGGNTGPTDDGADGIENVDANSSVDAAPADVTAPTDDAVAVGNDQESWQGDRGVDVVAGDDNDGVASDRVMNDASGEGAGETEQDAAGNGNHDADGTEHPMDVGKDEHDAREGSVQSGAAAVACSVPHAGAAPMEVPGGAGEVSPMGKEAVPQGGEGDAAGRGFQGEEEEGGGEGGKGDGKEPKKKKKHRRESSHKSSRRSGK